MLNNKIFSYYPIQSIIHKQNSTCKIITLILLIFLVSLINHVMTVIVLFLIIIISFLSKIPFNYYLKINFMMKYFYLLLIIIFAFLFISLTDALTIILKFIIIFNYIIIITYTTSIIEVANGVENIVKPFNIFYLKIGVISLKIMMMLKFVTIFLSSTNDVIISQSSRGFDYNFRSSLAKIFIIIKSFPQIYRISKIKKNIIIKNMESKLYNYNKIRTNLNYNPISKFDIISLSLLCIILIFNLVKVL